MENAKIMAVIKDLVEQGNKAAKKYQEYKEQFESLECKTAEEYQEKRESLLCKINSQYGRYRAYNYALSTILCECGIDKDFTELGFIYNI